MKIINSSFLILIAFFAFGFFQNVTAQSPGGKLPKSMKGYELYSWKFRGVWYFSVLVGTNRRKTLEEIVSPKVRVKGVEALKKKLFQLPENTELILSVGSASLPQVVFPPGEIMDEISIYCQKHGIIFVIPPVRTNLFDKIPMPPDKSPNGQFIFSVSCNTV